MVEKNKPHVVCIPYPSQGHINPMLKLAKLLHSRSGFHVTFVNNHYNHRRLLRAGGLSGPPSFRFDSIPDGLPGPEEADVTQDVFALSLSIEATCSGPLKELIERLNDTASSGVPPVTCIVTDLGMHFALDVATEIGIPIVALMTTSASCLFLMTQFRKLLELGIIPFKDNSYMTNGELDKVMNWVPEANDIRLKDFPTFTRITDSNDNTFNFLLRMMNNVKKASAILLNTFEALENDAIQSFNPNFPPLYAIGPLQLMLDDHDIETNSINLSLWKNDPSCLVWLNSLGCELNSVVYVNFGSIVVMTNAQLLEFAWGLANSKQPFLWIIRSDLVRGESAVLPPEFLEETKGRGFIADWCDQEKVLSHPAISVFLTHCGWNSTMESINNGVPMICWPFFGDQQTNSWYSCTKWGVGLEIDSNVKRDDIERQVKELMEGEKGNELRKKAMEWKRLAREATQASGSSYLNYDNAIKMMLSN